jgi:copper chaperone CopZ
MHCEPCAVAITAAVTKLDGVTACEVDHVSGRAVVRHDPARASAAAISAAITKLGYTVAAVTAPAPNPHAPAAIMSTLPPELVCPHCLGALTPVGGRHPLPAARCDACERTTPPTRASSTSSACPTPGARAASARA